jgi:acyl-CoA-binding protein
MKPVAPRQDAEDDVADLQQRFEAAQRDIQTLSERPDNATLLRLYALYKQGTLGDATGEKPGFFDFIGAAKYDAWAKLKGMPRDEAMKGYTSLVRKLAG